MAAREVLRATSSTLMRQLKPKKMDTVAISMAKSVVLAKPTPRSINWRALTNDSQNLAQKISANAWAKRYPPMMAVNTHRI